MVKLLLMCVIITHSLGDQRESCTAIVLGSILSLFSLYRVDVC